MTVEIPIEMLHLPQSLRTLFTGMVPETASGTGKKTAVYFQCSCTAPFEVRMQPIQL